MRMIRHRSYSRHSFTLLELMAAMAIFSLVGLIIGTSLSAFARSWRSAQKVSAELERNQAIDHLVETMFRGAIPFMWPDEDEGEDRYVFQGKSDELYITSLSRTHSGNDAFRFVRLYRDGEELLCDWSTVPLLPWLELETQKYQTDKIASGVQEITFRYAADGQSNDPIDWYEEWDEDELEGIPLAIQLTIEWTDGTSERWLRRTAGTSGNTALAVSSSTLSSGASSSGNSGNNNRSSGSGSSSNRSGSSSNRSNSSSNSTSRSSSGSNSGVGGIGGGR